MFLLKENYIGFLVLLYLIAACVIPTALSRMPIRASVFVIASGAPAGQNTDVAGITIDQYNKATVLFLPSNHAHNAFLFAIINPFSHL
jgi:hypothetical protein